MPTFLGQLKINSSDNKGQTISNARYELVSGIRDVKYIAVAEVCLLNLQYDIAANDVFSYNFNSTDYSYIFTNTFGNYSAATLAALLQSVIRAQTGSTTLTVAFNTTTQRLEFNTGNASLLQVISSTTHTTTILRSLGFIMAGQSSSGFAYPTIAATSFSAPSPILLPRTCYFDFCSSALTQFEGRNLSTGTDDSVLYRLPCDLAYGNTLFKSIPDLKYIQFNNKQSLTSIDLRILNDDRSIANLNNSVYYIVVNLYG